jgi:hypothetical protein
VEFASDRASRILRRDALQYRITVSCVLLNALYGVREQPPSGQSTSAGTNLLKPNLSARQARARAGRTKLMAVRRQ